MSSSYRYAEEKLDRLPSLAEELVRLNVDVIRAAGPADGRAAKDATKTIPIVMANVADPVASGLVASLARPGGNHGISTLSPELSREATGASKGGDPQALPRGFLGIRPTHKRLKGLKLAAGAHSELQLQSLEVQTPNENRKRISRREQSAQAALSC